MFKRIPKKQNRLKRIILRLLNVYAVERDNFNLINPPFINEGKSKFFFNDKSFVFPNGYVEIKRKVTKLDILFRYTGTVNLWKTSKKWKRIIPDINKETLILSCFNSMVKSITDFNKENKKKVIITIHLVDDGHQESLNNQMNALAKKWGVNTQYHKNVNQGNRESFLKCLELAKECDDLVLFVEDDYLFEISAIKEMIQSYSRISTMLNEEINISLTDYPFYYDALYKTAIVLGSERKYRFVGETLMTFLTSKKIINENYELIKKISTNENDPFEIPLHELYKKSPCFAPVGSLAYHVSTISPGLSPHDDWKKTWNENVIHFDLN